MFQMQDQALSTFYFMYFISLCKWFRWRKLHHKTVHYNLGSDARASQASRSEAFHHLAFHHLPMSAAFFWAKTLQLIIGSLSHVQPLLIIDNKLIIILRTEGIIILHSLHKLKHHRCIIMFSHAYIPLKRPRVPPRADTLEELTENESSWLPP